MESHPGKGPSALLQTDFMTEEISEPSEEESEYEAIVAAKLKKIHETVESLERKGQRCFEAIQPGWRSELVSRRAN